MKKLLKLLPVVFFGITTVFFSCNKDDDKSTAVTPSGIVGTTISGVVFNTGHLPLNGVEVSVGSYVKTTGVDGAFLFENIPVSNDRYKVEFKKDNYFETYRSGKAEVNGVTKVEVSMVELNVTEQTTFFSTINTTAGGVLYNTSIVPIDTILYFPPNLNYIRVSDGTSYVGNVDVYIKYVDAALPEYSQIVAGGDQFGRIGSYDYYLSSFSGVMVALFDDNGNQLDLGSNYNELAEIHIKIPDILVASAPDSIDTWYNGGNLAYASNNGGSGRKNGGKYVSSVGHFSLWSMQTKFSEFGTITGRITDCSGEPVNGVRVQVGQSYAITNNDGIYSRVVAAGVDNIVVQVLAEDYFNNVSAPIIENALTSGELRADVDIQLPCAGTITGYLVNCSGQPVPGQVIITDGGTNISKTYTENGYFELKFDQNSSYYTIYAKGYNYSTSVVVSGASFPYNVGNIILCPPVPPPPGSNTVTIDGVNYSDFNNTADGGVYGTSVSLYAHGDNDYFSMELENCTGVGSWPIQYGSISIGTSYYDFQTGTATITTFDDVDGRIIGTFTGTGVSGEDISGTFNVKRNPDSSSQY